jgi:peptidoglycan hydrolase CwlO-like protein
MTGPHYSSGAPMDAQPPDATATVEDVRTTRRWTWVALAWAIAASIVAVLALVQANDSQSNDNQQSTNAQDAATQLRDFENQVNDRLDAFSRRLNETASKEDLDKLGKQVTQLSEDVDKVKTSSTDQATAVKQLQTDVDDLSKRVDQLEQQQSQGQTQTP